MRLRQLRIKGFKSFANDTIINFNEDVIGIVGPNGSGKSNIVDAIRWVLGEQKTKELRLEKMTDVIFNGTKSRKKAGIAQVTLTFENSKNILPIAYNNVAISRILYRSGESEYRLNNVSCRLKDINNLFRDTGVGSNSYAILALGMVDDLLADKENARRKMFEQAAGISKFKSRKKETFNKLKATSADLDRVEDLLFEIEKNIKSLERQARRAKKYLQLKEDYQRESIQLSLLLIGEYKEHYKTLEKQIGEEEHIYRDKTVLQRKLESELEKVQKNNLDEEIKLSAKQKELNITVSKIRDLENARGISNQKLVFANQNIESNIASIKRDELALTELKKEVSSISTIINEETSSYHIIQKSLLEHKDALAILKEQYQKAKHSADEKINKHNQIQSKLFNAEKQIAILNNSIDNLNKRIEIQVLEEEQLKSTRKELDKAIKEITKELEEEKKNLTEYTAKLDAIARSKEKLQVKIKNNKESLARINRSTDAKENEYNLLKSMIDNLEGFPESIKYLTKKWKKDVPLLSDMISCDDEYRGALEQYLEPYLNYFVIRNVEEGFQAIDILTQAQKGKAQFFVLDQINTSKLPQTQFKGTIPATSIIEIDNEYAPLLELLLHNVYISDDKSLLNGKIPSNAVLLSKSGEVFRTSHSITGGSIGLFEGKKIGRKKSLKKIEKQLKSFEKDRVVLQADMEKYEAKLKKMDGDDMSNHIRTTNEKIKQLERSFFINDTKRSNQDSVLKTNAENKKNHLDKINGYKKEKETYQNILLECKEELNKLSISSNEDEELEAFSKRMTIASEKYNESNVHFIRQENKLDNLQKDLNYRNTRIKDVQTQLDRYDGVIEKDKQKSNDIKEELIQLEKELLALYKLKEEGQKELNGVEQSYFNERQKIKSKEDELRDINRLLQTKQVLINKKKESYNDIKFKIQSVNERLKIEFNLSVNDIINQTVETKYTIDEIKEITFKLKTKIDQFGEVNPMAVETYEEMKNRHETITVQRNDIMSARKSLESTIKEIEKQATEQFMDAFVKIRTHFIEVFRTLFTENDKCDLILVDEDNPLESKIEIIAKPKGKRPQSLSQLSGGEKTLTATALLFALYLLKPAPFCIFDEIDAPLDDINIQKFNKLIAQFSKDSQFIIITHNKDTMTELGTMYGIFMQEPGVSGLSLVDFRDMSAQN